MVHFSLSVVVVVVAVLVIFGDQALGEGSGDSVVMIEGSGNGEYFDGSGEGEIWTETNMLPPECTEEFRASANHTMCIYVDDARVIKSGVSEEDKARIVEIHNRYRQQVEPPATDLSKLVWDDKIASVAQKWAKQCVSGHDKNRVIPSYGVSIGQNAAGGQADWEGAVGAWYNEVQLFKYGEDPEVYIGKGGWKKVGHYTQVVQNTAYRIGCGYAECSGSTYKRYYICNYGEGQSKISRPYTEAESEDKRCGACPNSCKEGLCDCGGKMCLNDGVLDINTCTCNCPRNFNGAECQTLNCPSSDKSNCWNSVFPKHCNVDWVRADCPYMCRICGGENAATPPPEFVSTHGCTYRGQRPSAGTCSGYGDNGMDTRNCETRGGPYGCDACTKYSNVKSDFCPVMCGMCDGPCDGKVCKNDGTLNRETCQCTCPAPYTGETCETSNCPDSLKDGHSCWKSLTPPDCAKYSNVPSMCPWMCGLCGEAGATPPPVIKSSFGCTHVGQQASTEECQAYGNKGADTGSCASQGGPFNCAHCTQYSNVKTQYCPVMCGFCAPACNGKKCFNGGQIDTDTCKCSCPAPFSGDTCDKVVCPAKDKWQCQFFQASFCTQYSNVPEDCPHLCGYCAK